MTPVCDLDGADPRATSRAAQLLAASVPAEAAGLVPYTLAGYHRYLAVLLGQPPAMRSVLVRALIRDGLPVAVADWRVLADTLFLNGVSVAPQWRGRGLGSRLLEDGTALARSLQLPHLALDVAAANAAAVALYLRTGFTVTAESPWCHVPTREPATTAGAVGRLLDWPVFCALRSAYGFADLSLRDRHGAVRVVRAVGDALRLDPRLPESPVSAADLCELTGCRRAYVVGGASASPFISFVRMTATV